jgi:hypothetical protein
VKTQTTAGPIRLSYPSPAHCDKRTKTDLNVHFFCVGGDQFVPLGVIDDNQHSSHSSHAMNLMTFLLRVFLLVLLILMTNTCLWSDQNTNHRTLEPEHMELDPAIARTQPGSLWFRRVFENNDHQGDGARGLKRRQALTAVECKDANRPLSRVHHPNAAGRFRATVGCALSRTEKGVVAVGSVYSRQHFKSVPCANQSSPSVLLKYSE